MSAFYDQASLVVVPSGYKSGKIYAQKPLTTDGQLTFTRASTATRVNASGLIETVSSGVPRLDYTNSSCPKILLEPQRSNLYPYSSQLDQWTASGATVTANDAVSPDGTTNADRVQFSANTDMVYYSGTGSAGENTLSVYAKAKSGTSQKFRFFANGATTYSSDQTATAEWQRFTFTYTYSAATAGLRGATTGAGDVLFYGFQHEVGSYATSYIPTTSAAVTRLADTASKTGVSSLVGGTEGTMFVEGFQNSPVTCVPFQLSDGTNNNRVQIEISSVGAPLCVVSSGGTTQAVIVGSSKAVGTNRKIAITFKANEFKLYENGQLIGTDTSGAIPVSLSAIYLGSESGSVYTGFTYKQILDFKTALTEAQAKELTTL